MVAKMIAVIIKKLVKGRKLVILKTVISWAR